MLQLEKIFSKNICADFFNVSVLENVPKFSALCLLFAERLSDTLGGTVPFGLIDVTWPGTDIEAWSSPFAIETCSTPPNNEYIYYKIFLLF